MLRSFVLLLTLGLSAGALGCSDPVPAAAAVGLRLSISPSGSCAADNTRPDDIGSPPPDNARVGTDPKKGRPWFDGENGLNAVCEVSSPSQGTFAISANASAPGVSLGVSASMTNGSATMAQMSFTSAAIGGSIAGSSCSLTAIPVVENGMQVPGVKAGAVWASFSCTNLLQQGSPAVSCGASGEILFENCSQN